ncbi:putative US22-like protein [Namao virus]|nr:putative US22-like protein [Namao virus]
MTFLSEMISDLCSLSTSSEDYLRLIKDLVGKYQSKMFYINEYSLRISRFDDTEYKNKYDSLKLWKNICNRYHIKLKVIGEIQHFFSHGIPLLILVCSDGKIYGYDLEHLHIVANSFNQFITKGVIYPSKVYYDFHKGMVSAH